MDVKGYVRFTNLCLSTGSLFYWNLENCTSLTTLPREIATESLQKLIELLTGLVFLNLNDCKILVRLPSTINGWKSLRTVNLSRCSKLENMPQSLGQMESLEELDVSGTVIRQPVPSIFFPSRILKVYLFVDTRDHRTSSSSWHLWFPFSLMQKGSSDSMALMLPSLSGLCFLTELNLSNCNLGEGAISCDICILFSWRN